MSQFLQFSPLLCLIDDDEANRVAISHILREEGYSVEDFAEARTALDQVKRKDYDLLLTDYKMPDLDGHDVLKQVRATKPELPTILMTAHGTVEMAVASMKLGAYDVLTKPFKKITLLRSIERSLERKRLLFENEELRRALQSIKGSQQFLGISAVAQQTRQFISQVANTSATVLILGESGSGKEVVASAIHEASPRKSRPFVKVSCAALPETLLEAELFGYEKGAFTGAAQTRLGRFEAASGGTLFLDEIGELSPGTQVKLLRFLQDHSFERLGSNATRTADVRIIAATNKDLQKAVEEQAFREDLFYRLNVLRWNLAALRHRKEDIKILAHFFLSRCAEKSGQTVVPFEPKFVALLEQYSWPGNVRELENTIERYTILGSEIVEKELLQNQNQHHVEIKKDLLEIPMGTPLSEIERVLILETLRRTDGDKALAAELLGITTRTIYRRLETYGKHPQSEL